MMGLVELIRGIATEERPSAPCARSWSSSKEEAGQRRGFPGLYRQRILLPMINEAVYALYEGVGNVEATTPA
jgi:3-hydroxybutyryl-CoA dehydrogenase